MCSLPICNSHPSAQKEGYAVFFYTSAYSGWTPLGRGSGGRFGVRRFRAKRTLDLFGTHRAFPHALPPSFVLRSVPFASVGLFFSAAAPVKKKTSRYRQKGKTMKLEEVNQQTREAVDFLVAALESGRGAESLSAIAKLKVKRILSDSRNPQIRWAMYFVQWITSSTGSQQYSELTTLFEAAFSAAHRRTPGWVGRLAIEMTFKRKRRKAWVRTISK